MTRRAQSIRAKLTLIQMATAGLLLLLMGTGTLAYEFFAFKDSLVRKTRMLSAVIGSNSTAALVFDDPKSAAEVLSALRAEPSVRVACIYDRSGSVFATYSASGTTPVCPPPQDQESSEFSASAMRHFSTIVLDRERVGTLYIESSLAELGRQLRLSLATLLGVSGLAALISLFASSRLQRVVSVPIVDLAKVASSISATGDYTVRAATAGEGEIGQLVSAFNQMLDQLHQRDQAVRTSREALENQTRILRSIVDNTAAAIYLKDMEGRFLLVNRECARLLDRRPDELLGKRGDDILPHDLARPIDDNDAKVIAACQPMVFEETLRQRDGPHIFLSNKFVLKDASGRPYALGGVSPDITERKRDEEAERLLADAGRKLVASLDYETTLQAVARIGIPTIADWTLLCVLHGGSDRSAREPQYLLAHGDAQRERAARDILAQYPLDNRPPRALRDALAAGVPRFDVDVQQLFSSNGEPRPGHLAALLELLDGGTAVVLPLLVRGDAVGALALVLSRLRPLSPGEAVLTELARRCAMAIDNARFYRQATEAVSAREEFMSVAAHELRTPLTPLRLQMEIIRKLIKDQTLTGMPRAEEFKRVVAASTQQVERLVRLVNDLLDVSRIAAGRIALNFERVSLSALVRDELERLHRDIAAAGCTLSVHIAPGVSGRWDRLRVVQIVVNLLTNALKYGKGGLIEVFVTADQERATLIVRDHGIGIAKEDQARIFNRYERAVSSTSFGGFGLGLYIAKECVSAHRGSITVDSEFGKGATFTVTLPLKPIPNESSHVGGNRGSSDEDSSRSDKSPRQQQ